jgi:ribosomal-protein-alanine N-acetyltransferase
MKNLLKMNLPPYTTFPKVSSDKITLRQVSQTEIADILDISFYDSLQAKSIEEAIDMQEKINQNYREGDSIHWGIANTITNELMGTCGFYRGFKKNTGELGCILLPKYYGQGIMTEALQLAIQFGHKSIGLNRIIAITTNENRNAIKLLERLDFVKTGDLDENQVEYELSVPKQLK